MIATFRGPGVATSRLWRRHLCRVFRAQLVAIVHGAMTRLAVVSAQIVATAIKWTMQSWVVTGETVARGQLCRSLPELVEDLASRAAALSMMMLRLASGAILGARSHRLGKTRGHDVKNLHRVAHGAELKGRRLRQFSRVKSHGLLVIFMPSHKVRGVVPKAKHRRPLVKTNAMLISHPLVRGVVVKVSRHHSRLPNVMKLLVRNNASQMSNVILVNGGSDTVQVRV